MVNTRQIIRLVTAEAFHGLVIRILENGRTADRATIDRLCCDSTLAPCGLGLAVQRLCELSFGPAREAGGLVERLMTYQRSSGLFGGSGTDESLSASAVALRALLAWRTELRDAGREPGPALDLAVQRGIEALVAASSTASDDERRVIDWQLGDLEEIKESLDCDRRSASASSPGTMFSVNDRRSLSNAA